MELILHAAIVAKNGMIFLGKCHADCFHQARHIGVDISQRAVDQGFFTNKGRYVRRGEAYEIAFNAGQFIGHYTGHILFSEMLWSPTENGLYNYDAIKGYYRHNENTDGVKFIIVELLRHSISKHIPQRSKDNLNLRYYVYCSVLEKKSWYDISKDVKRSGARLTCMKYKTEREIKRVLSPNHEARKRAMKAAKYLQEVLNDSESLK